ncbi:hypothetical protein [Nonomuraea endophytica]|uniref:hypothetical protein n=1 Tax=Nonomuraea endophytica TaxID=714136 RepID=UPI0037C7EBD3
MKSLIIALSLVAAAPVTAHAATAPDPLAALRKQLSAGKGVSFVQHSVRGKQAMLDVKGRLRYDASGLAASDITIKPRYGSVREGDPLQTPDEQRNLLLSSPEQIIRVGTAAYTKGKLVAEGLPAGKTWWKQDPGWTNGVRGLLGEIINPAEPATLKALLAKATRSGSTYRGKIRSTELLKISPWTRATMYWKPFDNDTITWSLTVTPSGLPRKLVTVTTGQSGKRVETTYTGWGRKTAIEPPPAARVSTTLNEDQMTWAITLPKAPRR